jgi:hypothetical protein
MRKDLTDKRFFNMVVVEPAFKNDAGVWYWKCKCDCGKEFVASVSNILRGDQKSCGCYRRIATSIKFKKHGDSNTRFFRIWCGVRHRTLNRKGERYPDYGGRGIKVCDRWLDYENFKADMYQSYIDHVREYGEKNTTIDRIENNGDYEPGNCKWSTYYQQNLNTRKNHHFNIDGEKYCLAELSRRFGIDRNTLSTRLRKGIPLEEALSRPIGRWAN